MPGTCAGAGEPARRDPPRRHPSAGGLIELVRSFSHAVLLADQRRTVKKQVQVGWLLRAVALIDLTTLAGDDTATNVHRLCLKVCRGWGLNRVCN